MSVSVLKWSSFVLGLAIVCVLVFWSIIHSKETAFYQKQVAFQSLQGSVAPPFQALTVDGHRVNSVDAKGPLVLELFATWCDICQSEVAVLNRLSKEKHVRVVAVAVDKHGMDSGPASLADLTQFRHRFKPSYETEFEPTGNTATAYHIVGYPSIFVVGRSGIILYNTAGQTSYEDLLMHIPS